MHSERVETLFSLPAYDPPRARSEQEQPFLCANTLVLVRCRAQHLGPLLPLLSMDGVPLPMSIMA